MTDPTAEGPAWVAPGSMPPPTPPTTAMPAPTAGYPSVAPPPAASYPTAYPSAYQPAPIPPPTAALPTRPDFRPGIVPLRPLNLGDIFPGVIASIRGNPKATMGLTLLICLAFLVPFTALGAWVASTNTPLLSGAERAGAPEEIQGELSIGLGGLVGTQIPTIGLYLAQVFLIGLMSWVISQAVQGRKVSAEQTWRAVLPKVLPLFGTLVLTVILLMAGVLAAMIPFGMAAFGLIALADGSDNNGGVVALIVIGFIVLTVAFFVVVLWLMTRFALAPAAVVLEDVGVLGSITRSWRLTSGKQVWRIMGIRLLATMAVGTIASIVAFVIQSLLLLALPEDQFFIGMALITGISSLVSAVITIPFSAGVDALLYIDQRIRREGLDVQLMQAVQGVGIDPAR